MRNYLSQRFAVSKLALFLICPTLCLAANFNVERWSSSNGVPVVFYQAMEVPMLDISFAFRAGAAYDNQDFGLSALTANLINEGNAGISALSLSEQLADTGAQFDLSTSKDMTIFTLRTLIKQEPFDKATTLFSKIISQPDFPNEAVNREKQQLLMALVQEQESPDSVAINAFFATLYQNHPYAHPTNGTSKTLTPLTRDKVVRFYHQYYNTSNATLVMVGAIDSKTAHQLSEKLTANLAKGKPAPQLPEPLPFNQAKTIHIPFPASQTTVRLGQIGITHDSKDYFPLMVGNYILGGGSMVSLLSVEVREKRGLTYGITSQLVPMASEGPFLIGLATKKNQLGEALSVTNDTLKKFIDEGPSDEMLQSAKDYLTGNFPMSLASNQAIATVLLRMSFYKLPDDYLQTYIKHINAVTVSDIKNAWNNLIHPNSLLLVTVGQS